VLQCVAACWQNGVCVWYGVATISRLLKIIGLFCRILSLFKGSFTKETYTFKEPTNRSHPIVCRMQQRVGVCWWCVVIVWLCVAVRCSVLQCTAVYSNLLLRVAYE